MNIMPAVVISVCSFLINSIAALAVFLSGESIVPILLSVRESLFNMYLTLFFIGGVTAISEWKQIHTSAAKKIFYTFP